MKRQSLEQSRAEQSRAEQSRAEQSRAEQSRAEQSRAEQLDCGVIQVGSVANQIESTRNNPQRQRVYDSDGLSPTLNCMQGGGLQPHIVDVKKIGSVEEMKDIKTIGNIYPDNPHQSGSVYDGDGIAPTLQSGTHSYGIPFIMEEKQIVAMRGRNPEDPSDRTPGVELEQRLEPNTQGICNTVTSVQKDNLVLETALMDAEGIRMVRTEEGKALRKAYESGEIRRGFNEYREPEIREDGVSNTITTVPKDTEIVETRHIIYDDYNSQVKQDQDTMTTLTGNCGSSTLRNGVKIIEEKKIKVRQATKEGFVEVELGGGGRPELPYIGHETRQSNRERSDMPYSDNGEYP